MLNIEKVVKLLDDFHYDVFRQYLKKMNVRSYYPLALVDVIDRRVEVEQDSDELCGAVYEEYKKGDEKTKKKFFQLAHHTFNLTSFLSRNYPGYLQNNFTKVYHLINTGELDRANAGLELLMDISRRVEDFTTELQTCQIMVQQCLIREALKKSTEYQSRITKVIKYQQEINYIYANFYGFYNLKEKDKFTDRTTQENKSFFRYFFDHSTKQGAIMSRYCYCYFLHYTRNPEFYKPETFQLLEETEKLLAKNETIIFPYLMDLSYRVRYLKLKYWNDIGDTSNANTYIEKIFKDSPIILYWGSLVNSAELAILSIECNLFAKKHLNLLDLKSEAQALPPAEQERLQKIQEQLQQVIKQLSQQEQYTIRIIVLLSNSAMLSLCGSESQIKEGIQELENLLIMYQQTPFYTYLDSVFTILGTGYFKLGAYQKVDSNFKRYKKSTRDQTPHPVNDLTIHAIYYMAMWLETGKKQYSKKFMRIYEQTSQNPIYADLAAGLEQIIKYYNLSVTA